MNSSSGGIGVFLNVIRTVFNHSLFKFFQLWGHFHDDSFSTNLEFDGIQNVGRSLVPEATVLIQLRNS